MVIAIGDRIDPPLSGSTTTGGTAGKSVSFASDLPDAHYKVSFELLIRAGGQLGEVWVPDATKTKSGFVFHNEGPAGLAVRWLVQRY